MNLGAFIDTFKDAIAQRVVESYPPLYRPSENGQKLPRLLRKPLGAQEDAIRGAALSLEAHRGTTAVGEMGTGKTFIAAAAAHIWRASSEDTHSLPTPPGAQVEAGGGDDCARRPRRHRQVHHRPGAAAHLHRLRPPLRGDEP